MEKNLAVPYSSQWDPDASKSNNDCGATSVRMILNYYGESKLTTDNVQEKTGAGGGLVTIEQLQNAISQLGYTSEFYTNQTLQNIKNFIDKDLPVIALVHYGSLNSTQDKSFKGGHFFVVCGYRDDNSLYVNDPNFKGDIRTQGDHHVYTQDEFLKSWGDCGYDRNPNNSFIVVSRAKVENVVSTGLKPANFKVRVTPDVGLKGRSTPLLANNNTVKTFTKDTILDAINETTGDTVAGVNIWYEVKQSPSNLYVWSGGVEKLQQEPPKQPEVKKEEVKKDLTDYQSLYESTKAENERLVKLFTTIVGDLETFSSEKPMQKGQVEPNIVVVKESMFDNLLKSLHLRK
jgi:hypothetical protein